MTCEKLPWEQRSCEVNAQFRRQTEVLFKLILFPTLSFGSSFLVNPCSYSSLSCLYLMSCSFLSNISLLFYQAYLTCEDKGAYPCCRFNRTILAECYPKKGILSLSWAAKSVLTYARFFSWASDRLKDIMVSISHSLNHSPFSGVICSNKTWTGLKSDVAFYEEQYCRYVTGKDYRTALILSVFLGMFGIDRFYLGWAMLILSV